MRERTKVRRTYNIDIDASEKFKMICPDNKQSARINQFILDDIELHSDLILESDCMMKLKNKLGNLNIKLKDTNKIFNNAKIDIPIIKEDIAHVISQIEKQREQENKIKKEEDKNGKQNEK